MEKIKIAFPAIKIPGDMAYILGLFIATRVALTAVGYAAHEILWKQSFYGLDAFTKIWTVWDGWWYIGIARDGYSAMPVNDVNMANYAFFPLYPALVRLASFAFGDFALSGIIVSNICLLVACYYIYRYVGLDSDEATAKRSVKYLILFPAAFVFSAVLTESLFVALVVACRWPECPAWLSSCRCYTNISGSTGLRSGTSRISGASSGRKCSRSSCLCLAWVFLQPGTIT
jgi:hypothetical protein